jgi:predicted RNA-binding Zn-ribbon protein involved in translation (DUF1610 family)
MGLFEKLRTALGGQSVPDSDFDPSDLESEYEYKCLQCHNNFTSPNSTERAQCPDCGSVQVRGGSPARNIGESVSVDK